ncbi:hypothetical protein [Tropicimonas sp. IMCC34011]|uniref:hypothetical protein n=1 Tax=Tropicimonas sp. IMCC34011 TaxID=2248759 RepID=UPI001300B253|nr:hypothetical protein [Tropicimonas sp. IMCC34011]
MSDHTEAVKQARTLVSRSAVKLADSNPDLAAERSALVEALSGVLDRMLELEALTSALPPDLGNILDLPPELLSELSVGKGDELEDQLVTVINAYGGEATLDQILVGLYRRFEVVHKRRFIQNKLYRMEMIWGVEGKKGVYTTSKPEEATPDDPSGGDNKFTRGGYGGYGDDPEEVPF